MLSQEAGSKTGPEQPLSPDCGPFPVSLLDLLLGTAFLLRCYSLSASKGCRTLCKVVLLELVFAFGVLVGF
jgi:hypothetical protein